MGGTRGRYGTAGGATRAEDDGAAAAGCLWLWTAGCRGTKTSCVSGTRGTAGTARGAHDDGLGAGPGRGAREGLGLSRIRRYTAPPTTAKTTQTIAAITAGLGVAITYTMRTK